MIRVTARLRFTVVCIIYKSFSRNVRFGTGLQGVLQSCLDLGPVDDCYFFCAPQVMAGG